MSPSDATTRASAGALPDPVPCEVYCHTLADPTILGDDLRAAGAQALTCFALHMPARLFAGDHAEAKAAAVAATQRARPQADAPPGQAAGRRDEGESRRQPRPCRLGTTSPKGGTRPRFRPGPRRYALRKASTARTRR